MMIILDDNDPRTTAAADYDLQIEAADPLDFWRGLVAGLPISLGLWGVVGVVVWRLVTGGGK